MRAHYQAMVWHNGVVANPELAQLQHYGWDLDDGHFQAVMTSLSATPEAVTHLVVCSCAQYGA